IERAGRVPGVIILFAAWVAFSLCGQCVYDHRPVVNLFCLLESSNEHRNIVTVNIADVFETKLVDQSTRQYGRSYGVFHRLCSSPKALAHPRNRSERVPDFFLEPMIALGFLDAIQIAGQGADRRSY